MLEDLNPRFTRNPVWFHIKDLERYQKWEKIPKELIDKTLSGMEQKRNQMLAGLSTSKGKKVFGADKVEKFCNWITGYVAGVRKDLEDTSKYQLVDGNYKRLVSFEEVVK